MKDKMTLRTDLTDGDTNARAAVTAILAANDVGGTPTTRAAHIADPSVICVSVKVRLRINRLFWNRLEKSKKKKRPVVPD